MQAPDILVVCEIEKLLEYLRVENRHKEIEAGVIGNQRKQGNLFLAQRRQIQFVGGGQSPREDGLNFSSLASSVI